MVSSYMRREGGHVSVVPALRRNLSKNGRKSVSVLVGLASEKYIFQRRRRIEI